MAETMSAEKLAEQRRAEAKAKADAEIEK